MKNIVILILAFLSVTGCQEANLMLYQDEPRVYFGSYSRGESISFYYAADDIRTDTVYISVQTMGGPRNYDRPVSFKQVTKLDIDYVMENGIVVDSTVSENPYNAVPGKHFMPFDHEDIRELMVIPASEVSARIPVILLRDPSLKENEYYLNFELIENDEFKLGGAKEDMGFEINFADKLIKPNFWDTVMKDYYWGAYSTRKHEFMIEVSGERIDDEWWNSKVNGVTGAISYYQNKFKAALNAFNSDPQNIESGVAPLREIENDPTSNLIVFP